MIKKILLFLLLFVCTQSLNAFALTASFDKKISIKDTVLIKLKVAIHNQSYRLEPTFRSGTDLEGIETIITLKNPEGTFSYFPDKKKAIRMLAPWTQIDLITELQDFSQYLERLGATLVSSETLGDYECDVYTYQDPTYRGENKAWVWKEAPFPIKIELENGGLLQTMEYSNINLDLKVDDSYFQVPPGTSIEADALPSLRPALPQAVFPEEEPGEADLI